MNRRAWTSVAAGLAASLAVSACGTLKKPPAPQAVASAPVAQAMPEPAPPRSTPATPVTVKAASCVPRSLPRAPKYPDTAETLRDAGGAADRYQLMAAGRILRERRLIELERAIDACR